MSLYNKIFESDERMQRLRRSAMSGDEGADVAYHRALARAGDDHEHMRPHAERWHKAMKGSWHGPENQAELKSSRAELTSRAEKFGRPAGVYVSSGTKKGEKWRRPDDDRQDHIELIGDLHNSAGGNTTLGGLDGSRDFRSEKDAKDFHDSVRHHYPDSHLKVEPYEGWDDRNSHTVSWNHQSYLDPKRNERLLRAKEGRRTRGSYQQDESVSGDPIYQLVCESMDRRIQSLRRQVAGGDHSAIPELERMLKLAQGDPDPHVKAYVDAHREFHGQRFNRHPADWSHQEVIQNRELGDRLKHARNALLKQGREFVKKKMPDLPTKKARSREARRYAARQLSSDLFDHPSHHEHALASLHGYEYSRKSPGLRKVRHFGKRQEREHAGEDFHQALKHHSLDTDRDVTHSHGDLHSEIHINAQTKRARETFSPSRSPKGSSQKESRSWPSLYSRLFEGDERRRRLERQARTGDPEARAAWAREFERSGEGMGHHLGNYVDAIRNYNQAPDPQHGDDLPVKEMMRRKVIAAAGKVRAHANDTGEVASHYLTMDHVKAMGEPRIGGRKLGHREHIGHMARLHGGNMTPRAFGGQGYMFNDEQSAKHLHSAIKKHYPDLKPYVVNDDPMRGKHRVMWY